jgi:hypothetical protein
MNDNIDIEKNVYKRTYSVHDIKYEWLTFLKIIWEASEPFH